MLLHLLGAAVALSCAVLWRCVCFVRAELGERSLLTDLALLQHTYGDLGAIVRAKKRLDTQAVSTYYEQTTDRDYRLLALCVGPGLHTRLVSHQGGFASQCRQPALVMLEIARVNGVKVLEIGCGRGYCTRYLAGLMPGVTFHGVDLVGRHVEAARKESKGYGNVEFFQGDAMRDLSMLADHQYDVIFGVESLCHMDDPDAFFHQIVPRLRPKGRLVIVDGFRSDHFHRAPENPKLAMRLAEAGFRIRRMPSKARWIRAACRTRRMRLVKQLDLTRDALPFWTTGWRVARVALHAFWPAAAILRLLRPESAANLLAVATTAHAMRGGAAEYGEIVFVRV